MKHSALPIEQYKHLINRYQKTLNLISSKGLEMLDDKISDAIEYGKLLQDSPNLDVVLDLGSGIGLPAVVIAIMLPEVEIHLVERRQRRIAFLKIVVSQLELSNCVLHSNDVRKLVEPKVSHITAQAVASFAEIYELTKSLHREEITMISRKGSDWLNEIEPLERNYGTNISFQETKGLSSHGSLVAVSLSGGLRCLP